MQAPKEKSQHAFHLAGVSLAGHPISDLIKPGECVRVFTGAKVPDECDQIILQEEVKLFIYQLIWSIFLNNVFLMEMG